MFRSRRSSSAASHGGAELGEDMLVVVDRAVHPFIVLFHDPSGFRAEQIRGARNKLIAMNPDGAAKTLVVTSAIRGEGTSNDYLLPEVPALPAFALQRAVSTMIRDLGHDYWTGTVYTTNRRVWEHDTAFKERLRAMRCMAIDMETATIFAAGFANRIPCGALLLVSDQPMIPEGVKTEASDARVSADYVDNHITVGIEALRLIRRNGKSVRHLRFDE